MKVFFLLTILVSGNLFANTLSCRNVVVKAQNLLGNQMNASDFSSRTFEDYNISTYDFNQLDSEEQSEIYQQIKPLSVMVDETITDLNKSYLESGDLSLSILNSEYAWFDTGDTDQMFEATMYIKSIQNRTNQMIGSVELETYKAGNINIDELNKLLYNMPECKYKQSIVKAVSLPF